MRSWNSGSSVSLMDCSTDFVRIIPIPSFRSRAQSLYPRYWTFYKFILSCAVQSNLHRASCRLVVLCVKTPRYPPLVRGRFGVRRGWAGDQRSVVFRAISGLSSALAPAMVRKAALLWGAQDAHCIAGLEHQVGPWVWDHLVPSRRQGWTLRSRSSRRGPLWCVRGGHARLASFSSFSGTCPRTVVSTLLRWPVRPAAASRRVSPPSAASSPEMGRRVRALRRRRRSGLLPLRPRSGRGPGAPAPGRPPTPAAPPRRRPGGRGLRVARRSRPVPGDRPGGQARSRSTASLAARASGMVSTTRRAADPGGLQNGWLRRRHGGEARAFAWSARFGLASTMTNGFLACLVAWRRRTPTVPGDDGVVPAPPAGRLKVCRALWETARYLP